MATRNTKQSTMVLEAVKKLKNHPAADEVYAEIVKTYPSISRATVYRNLQKLSDMGKVRKCTSPSSPDRYDHNLTGHYHIKCSVCGRFDDVGMKYLEDIVPLVEDSRGYKITDHDIIFKGVCADCLKLRNKK